MHIPSAIILGLLGQATSSYVWPSKYDHLEDLLAMHSGYLRFGFSDLVVPCGFGSGLPGVQNAAEWVRSVFHDIATFDASTGVGGLDASLQFELDRPENVGSAFNNTFAAMYDFITPQSSVSDLLALSLVAALAACDGPKVPLRAGRVDATEAGPAGVPKPEDDLESTRKAFLRAGFNDEDMITMVACGHSLGNVHSVNFPELVSGEATEENVAPFDSSPTNFDNTVVTEYLDDSTSNPLIVGANDTMKSDKRVFGADGNATMSALADPANFQAKCADIFERMLDTVPSTVTLSDPIEIVDVKPYIDPLHLQEDGSVLLQGRVRVRNNPEQKINGDDLEVSLSYRDLSGASISEPVVANRARARGGQSFGFWDNTFTWFEFSQSLNATASIRDFDIHLKTSSSGALLVLDNEGTGGYAVTSDLLYQQPESCLINNGAAMALSVTAALRKDLVDANSPPVLHLAHRVARPGVMLPRLQLETIAFELIPGVEKSGYQYFRANATVEASGWSTTFDIEAGAGTGGKVHRLELLKTNALSDTCGSIS
ncbi:hypothetical protein JX265_002317 [Neoarthrinium moseri]|uniref:Peroxidase n=1 Tax=Neoarthrinium moseri TaxID=1658444 RepID=A0A9P9WU67_9PEZI|nr:hypothetical protein JX265_002317 [Neoarthrinium moseri]